MTKLTAKWPVGNFLATLESEVDDTTLIVLANLGLKAAGQRVSEVDRILGGFQKGSDGKSKRIEGWKRGDVAFTPDLAEKLTEAFGELVVDDGSDDGLKVQTLPTFVLYEGSTSEPKFAEEKAMVARHDTAGDTTAWAKTKVGYAGDGPLTVENLDFLRAIKAFKLEALKGM